MPGKHALLSPSSASRWLHCTRAPRLEEQFPESTSKYAEAGTLAHAIAELKARKYFLEPMSTRTYNSQLKKLKNDPCYDASMDRATDEYLDYLKSIALGFGENPPFVALESKVGYSNYAQEGSGKADCIMISPPILQVIDYKNGAGVPVPAEDNPQMMLYALGALDTYDAIYGDSIREIRMAIVQPNAGGVKEWELSRGELENWGEEVVKPAAALAYEGKGDFAPSEDRCRFCRAKATCGARAKMYLNLEQHQSAKPPLLADTEVGDVLTRAKGLSAWVSDLEDYALKTILAGGCIPGYKAVEGRSSRVWSDVDTAFTVLQERGVAEALLWERKPVTPPALENALGKKAFTEAADGLVQKKPGKPALALEGDKRPVYNSAEMAFGSGADG